MRKGNKQKKKKRWFSTALICVLFATGLLIMFYPKLSNLYTRFELSQELVRYNQELSRKAAMPNTESAELERAEEYNAYLLEKDMQLFANSEEREWARNLLNPLKNGVMGEIVIPRINVDLPIYQGTESQLQQGAGWWIGSSLPIGGESTHSIITAHTGLVKADFFTHLDQLELGDLFMLKVYGREMYYQIDQIKVVLPDELEELKIQPGHDYVTLYTCTPYGVNTHRLLVRGTRMEEISASDRAEFEEKSYIWMMMAAAVCAALIIFLTIRNTRRHAQRDEIDLHDDLPEDE